MDGYPEDQAESTAPPPQPPPPRPRPSRPPWPPRPPRPTPPPKHTPNPRVFKVRYFYNGSSFRPCPFHESSRPQTPPESPEIFNKNPWCSARSDKQKKTKTELPKLEDSANSEEEEI